MRWPIQLQLLLPMLSVVIVAILLASGTGAYFSGLHVRQLEQEHLRRVVATLTQARFPPREPVLRQMRGLSGADFLFYDQANRLQATTLATQKKDLDLLAELPHTAAAGADEPGRFAGNHTIQLEGCSYLVQCVRMPGQSTLPQIGWLMVLYPEDEWTGAPRRAAYPALLAGGVAIIVVVLVTMAVAPRFVRPIQRLVGQTAAIAQGDFQPVAVGSRNDEIRDLAVSINQMTERLSQYEVEVRRSERLRTLGQLGAGIAHQLRNAATGGRMAIELHARQCVAAAAAKESLDVALRQLRLMESYLQRFLALGQPHAKTVETVALASLVEDSLPLVQPACAHAGIQVTLAKPDVPLTLRGDPNELRQLVLNLLINAVEAAGANGAEAKRIAVELEPAGDRAVLRVKDSGPGPDPAVVDRLFEPFVSGKPDGTGLGLYVARQIAEDHHGSIRWQRADGMTCFSAEFPLLR
jgi:signal transduction histidine kinase